MFLYGLVWGHNPIFVDFGLSCHKSLSNLYYKNRSGGERMVVFISPNGLQYTFDRFSSSTSSTYFYAEPYPRKTLIEKEFNWNYTTDNVGTTAVALKFSDNTTSVDFYSHGGDLLITGGVYGCQNSGGNHYVGISIDNGEPAWVSSSPFTSWHYIPLNKLVRGLSVGSHNIRLMAYTNLYTANFVGTSLSKVIFQEV